MQPQHCLKLLCCLFSQKEICIYMCMIPKVLPAILSYLIDGSLFFQLKPVLWIIFIIKSHVAELKETLIWYGNQLVNIHTFLSSRCKFLLLFSQEIMNDQIEEVQTHKRSISEEVSVCSLGKDVPLYSRCLPHTIANPYSKPMPSHSLSELYSTLYLFHSGPVPYLKWWCFIRVQASRRTYFCFC